MTIKLHSWELNTFALICVASAVAFWLTLSHIPLLIPLCLLGFSFGVRLHQAAIREISGAYFIRSPKDSRPTTTVLLPEKMQIEVGTSPGFIYVMKRSDGIYKLGRSGNPGKRQKEHASDYGQEFEIVKRFAVPDTKALERVALQLTAQYHYSEASRNELRRMDDSEIRDFLEKFGEICKTVIDK